MFISLTNQPQICNHTSGRSRHAAALARNLAVSIVLALIPLASACSGGNSGSTSNPPNFSITANPTSLQIPAGGSGYAVVSVVRRDGFTGPVTLSVPGLPTGVGASGTIVGGETTGYLTVAVDEHVVPQSWSVLALDGSANSLTSTTPISLSISAPLPTSSLSVDLVAASGGRQTAGNVVNTAVFMEPVTHTTERNLSQSVDNQAGFLPDAVPSNP